VIVARVGPESFAAREAELARVYDATFAGPPWDEGPGAGRAFLAWLDVHAPGFRAAVAETPGGALAGFACGATTPDPFPSGRAYGSVAAALGDGGRSLVGRFEVLEVAVDPSHRGAGHGRAVLAALLDGAGPAWLLTDVRAAPAMRIYRRSGLAEVARARHRERTLAVFAGGNGS
jgi:ribosomal protein S18 acetylase RimI-like enzyme